VGHVVVLTLLDGDGVAAGPAVNEVSTLVLAATRQDAVPPAPTREIVVPSAAIHAVV